MDKQTKHTLRQIVAAFMFMFWFIIAGTPAFCAAVPVDVLWAGLFDNSGQPLAGGLVYTYAAGTTTNKATYADSAKVTTNANPVVLDAYGRAAVYADGAYKFVIKDADGVTLVTIDNLEFVSSQNPSTLSTTALSATGATIGSLTANVGVLTNMTISSATITLANLISPNISNASMTGSIYGATITGGTVAPATFSFPAGYSLATPSAATDPANKGYVDAQIASVSSGAQVTAQYGVTNGYYTVGSSTVATAIVAASSADAYEVTGFSVSNPSAATQAVMIDGFFYVSAVSSETATPQFFAYLVDDQNRVYSTIRATVPQGLTDTSGFPEEWENSMHVSACLLMSPSETRTFYLKQDTTWVAVTYKAFVPSGQGFAQAFRIVRW